MLCRTNLCLNYEYLVKEVTIVELSTDYNDFLDFLINIRLDFYNINANWQIRYVDNFDIFYCLN